MSSSTFRIKLILLFGASLLLNACTTVQFKDIEIEKLEKVSAKGLPEAKILNSPRIGDYLLKVYLSSKTDFSEFGLKKLNLRGPLYVESYLCDSVNHLAFLYNGPETVRVGLADLFTRSIPLDSHGSSTDRIEWLDNEEKKS